MKLPILAALLLVGCATTDGKVYNTVTSAGVITHVQESTVITTTGAYRISMAMWHNPGAGQKAMLVRDYHGRKEIKHLCYSKYDSGVGRYAVRCALLTYVNEGSINERKD